MSPCIDLPDKPDITRTMREYGFIVWCSPLTKYATDEISGLMDAVSRVDFYEVNSSHGTIDVV